MNFGGRKPEPVKEDPAAAAAPTARYAGAPPPCPRCEVIKQQATKTVINYQRAHRRKLEALRTELKSSRKRAEELQRKVNQLSSLVRVHAPSVLLGAVLGLAIRAGVSWLQARRSKSQQHQEEEEEEEREPQQQEPAAAAGGSVEAAPQVAVGQTSGLE